MHDPEPIPWPLFRPVAPDEIETEIAEQEVYLRECDEAIEDIWEDAKEAEDWIIDRYDCQGDEGVERLVMRDRTSRAEFGLAYDRRRHRHAAYIAALRERLTQRTGTES